jgi:ketosteroid isomerase-like protein
VGRRRPLRAGPRRSRPLKPIDAYIADHNEGVRTGDWSRFADWFTDDAEMHFEGAPVGPFRGREEIQHAYEERPPDDEIEIRNVRSDGNSTTADYGWRGEGGVRAGELRLLWDGARVRDAVIRFG